ncbi:MAG: rhomboid family intramembrane serine protease [Solirubrobacterales bacterium]|nr:rhomboid family intramembrane serine protease [Solirubrobacterales bacterium]
MADTAIRARPSRPLEVQRQGVVLLVGIVLVMWVVEVINTLDSNRLDSDGIYGRSFGHLWGILTAPFIHASFAHLIGNTIPFVFMGLIIAWRGAGRLALVTGIVILVGGLGTWLVAPSNIPTIGASGVVFGYAAYLFARGFFNRRPIEVLVGLAVGVIWGGALAASLVPHSGISWQGHVFGLVGGVTAAALLRRERPGAQLGVSPPGRAAAK